MNELRERVQKKIKSFWYNEGTCPGTPSLFIVNELLTGLPHCDSDDCVNTWEEEWDLYRSTLDG